MLPQDPAILLSYVNTKLRDCYPSLAALCDDLQADEQALADSWQPSTITMTRSGISSSDPLKAPLPPGRAGEGR